MSITIAAVPNFIFTDSSLFQEAQCVGSPSRKEAESLFWLFLLFVTLLLFARPCLLLVHGMWTGWPWVIVSFLTGVSSGFLSGMLLKIDRQ
jgi:hypothetical protein